MMPGTWTTFSTPVVGSANLVADTMLLLTDGSVLVHQEYAAPQGSFTGFDGSVWMRLVPDNNGNYATGTWTGPYRMANQREYFASGITFDGRVFALGGEFSNAGGDTPLGEIFDPLAPAASAWSPMTNPFGYIQGDIASSGLADGRVLFGSLSTAQTAIWDPANNAWLAAGTDFGSSPSGTKDGVTNEETWTLLPDGSVLTVETKPSATNPTVNPAERYVPSTDLWVSASGTPQPLVVGNVNCTYIPNGGAPQPQSVQVFEIGPAILLPDGTLFAIGATGNTAIYTPSTDTWAAGPSFPADTSGNSYTDPNGNVCTWTSPAGLQGAGDAPAVLLPGGQVLCCAGNFRPATNSPNGVITLTSSGAVLDFFNTPTTFYEYDPAHPNNGLVPLANQPTAINGSWTWLARLLLLPNGQVLYSANGTTLALYQPSPAELAPVVPLPTIGNFGSAEFPAVLIMGHTYTITGTNLNGISQANSYGDDAQMASNYPLVRATNTATNQVVYFRTINFSSLGVAVPGTVSCDLQVPYGLAIGQWSLVVVANAVASNPVTVQIASQDLQVYMDITEFGANEIAAWLQQNGNNPVTIPDLLHVIVEGFSQDDIGSNVPQIPDLSPTVHIVNVPPYLPENPALPSNVVQRFTFLYQITFDDTSIFAGAPETLTITATFTPASGGGPVSGSGRLQLTRNPVPFILHGDATQNYTWYLSQDIRVFQVIPTQPPGTGGPKFGVTYPSTGNAANDATGYIAGVIQALNANNGGGISGSTDTFGGLNETEDNSALAIGPLDSATHEPVFNFAVARVHYRDTQAATNIRLFFRTYAAQQTSGTYDSGTTYRAATYMGQKIPLLGVQGDEIVTIPFFATPRVANGDMTTQTDTPNVALNVSPGAGGAEVQLYYGAWLDLNQPNAGLFPDRIVGGNENGPFTNEGPLLPIQQWARSAHQCLVCEISFDPDPITPPADPSNSSFLAQRNLTFVGDPNPGVDASRRAPQTFEIRPSPTHLLTDMRPDELMIDSSTLPPGGAAQLYLPAASAAEILDWASRLYTTHSLTQVDANTVQFPTGGFIYVPIPQGGAVNYAGLLTIDLPRSLRTGQIFQIVIRQATSAEAGKDVRVVNEDAAVSRKTLTWRRIIGTFHLTIPVSTKQNLLAPEERLLAILRWIQLSIPSASRWFPIFNRYIGQVAGRVAGFGGDPTKIAPSPTGGVVEQPCGEPDGDHLEERTGKITGLRYDKFGDFCGFNLVTRRGAFFRFESRETRVERLAECAWRQRLLVTIVTLPQMPHRLLTIILRDPPPDCD
jgi:hypothetical protein